MLIEHGRIIDGTGSSSYAGEVRGHLPFQAVQVVERQSVGREDARRRLRPAARAQRRKAPRPMLVEQREDLIMQCNVHALPPSARERARSRRLEVNAEPLQSEIALAGWLRTVPTVSSRS
ncbi:MAG: hypothetical protein KGL36_02650 [Gammaproteobacteria bacterium]|nr:hypothetical protein [Gammaproteobacteria bacterium]